MEGEEQPGVVNGDVKILVPDLVMGAVSVSAMDVGLLREATGVGGVRCIERLHAADRFFELGCVCSVKLVGGRPNAEPGHRREFVVYDCVGDWGATVDVEKVSGSAIVGGAAGAEIGGLNRIGVSFRIGDEVGSAVETS